MGCLGVFLPTETDPCAVAFSFSSRDNFQLLRYCICTCNRITRVTVSLCMCITVSSYTVSVCTVSPCINVSPYTVSVCTLYVCITLYHCMYHCTHTVSTYHRTLYHCIKAVGCTAPHRKPGAVLYAAIDRGKQLATRELEPRRATPFELPPTANTSFARPLGRATLCTMAPPAAQACATRGVRSLQRSSPRSSASVRQAPRCRATDVNLDGERRATTCLVADARATASAVPW